MQGRKASVEDGDAAVDANVGVFVAAVGVGHRGHDERHEFPVEAGQVGVQVDWCPAGQGGDDPQDALLTAGQSAQVVLGDGLVVEPPPAGLVARLDPRVAGVGEPAVAGPDEQLDGRLERIQALAHERSPAWVTLIAHVLDPLRDEPAPHPTNDRRRGRWLRP